MRLMTYSGTYGKSTYDYLKHLWTYGKSNKSTYGFDLYKPNKSTYGQRMDYRTRMDYNNGVSFCCVCVLLLILL